MKKNMENPLTLRECREGDRIRILGVDGAGPFKRRLLEMGFLPGVDVLVMKYAPLRDPIEFVLKDSHISLRRTEAALVRVEPMPLRTQDAESPTA